MLLFYGLGPTDLPGFPDGKSVLRALTDEETAIRLFGSSPFVITRHGLRYYLAKDPVFQSQVGETHRDQCLATFAELHLDLRSPIHLKTKDFSILDLLAESIANFSLEQKEPAWTALAYTHYLPPRREWTNRFGERTTFSGLVTHLLHLNLNSQSCAGIHVLQALVEIEHADQASALLEESVRRELHLYLTASLSGLVRRQHQDGSWDKRWCEAITDDDTGTLNSLQYRVLVTGHLLDGVLNALDPGESPAPRVYQLAARWLEDALVPTNFPPSLVCPFTHAARAARMVLNPTPLTDPDCSTFHRAARVLDAETITKQTNRKENN